MRASPTRVDAFTLIELMIVIGMAALVMAISIPFVQRTLKRDAVYHAVQTVEEACRNARAQAIFHNAVAELVIRPQEREVRVDRGSSQSISPGSISPGPAESNPDSPADGNQG